MNTPELKPGQFKCGACERLFDCYSQGKTKDSEAEKAAKDDGFWFCDGCYRRYVWEMGCDLAASDFLLN